MNLDAWVQKTKLIPSKELAEKARKIIVRTLAEDFELSELWQESDEFNEWQTSVKNLVAKICI
ncbi:DUF4259 domain-containing protein [Undibacterium sp. Xuan67W]|uniref:DUF4259 domain-containing protein n=1 Tax=Undibacterium sp. Xuan67W TaxID=3413057 RepID=UPI003BF1F72D